ncbi:MAG TPA: NAD(P)-binding protein [Desulfomonilia bacterium]
MPDYNVAVVGAGLGGISAGAILASKGRRTLVLDQGAWVGGYCFPFKKRMATCSTPGPCRSNSPA